MKFKPAILALAASLGANHSGYPFRRGKVTALLISLFSAGSVDFLHAAVIWTNPITGTDPNTSNPYTTGQTFDANVTVSGIGRGAGATGAGGTDRYNANSWNTAALDPTAYFTFTLDANAGYKIDFTDFVYTAQRSNTSIAGFAFRSSLDSFAADIGSPDFDGTMISLSGAAYQNLSAPIEFRFYAWGAGSSGNTFSINDFTFNGAVSLVSMASGHLYWDTNADVAGVGGSGTWSSASTSFSTTPAGTDPAARDAVTDPVIFAGTAGTVTVDGTVEADGGITFDTTGYVLTGGTSVDLGGANAAANAITVASSLSATIQTSITGSTGLTKAGAGSLNLTSANGYVGETIVSGGILNIQNSSALGATGGGNGTSVSSGAALELQGGISVGAESLSLSGTGVSSGGALRNISGDNVFGGAITLTAASSITADSGALTLDVSSGNAVTGSNVGVAFGGAGAIMVTDGISLGSGGLSKSGAGTLTLQSTNSYTGGTTLSGGTLNFVSGALGVSGTVVFSGGTLQYATGNTQDLLATRALTGIIRIDTNGNNVTFASSANSLSGGTLTKVGAGTLALSPTDTATSITLTTIESGTLSATDSNYFGGSGSTISIGNATLQYAATYTGGLNAISLTSANSSISVTDGNTYQPGVISGAGTLNKVGLGTLNLGVSNNFSGGLVVSEGNVTLTGNNRLLNAGSINVSGGALNIAGFDDVVGAVTLTSGSITGSSGVLSASSFEVKSGSISARLNDESGSVVLTKNTGGTVVLTGSNLYDGGTQIDGGTLLVNNTVGSGTGTGIVSVNASGILGGTGSISGATTVAGTHSAGDPATNGGIGTQTFTSSLNYNSATSIFAWELGGETESGRGTSFDAVNVGGTLSVADSVFKVIVTGLNISSTFWDEDRTWDVFNVGSTGTFNTFQLFNSTDLVNQVTYNTRGGFAFDTVTGDVKWTAVPEPSSALVGLLIAAGLLRRRRVA